MTERATEIGLGPLAMKFAGGDRAKKREWERTLHEAVRAGTLEARAQRVEAPRVVKAENPFSSRFKTIGETTFAGMSARVVAPIGRQALTPRRAGIYHHVTPAAVAAWLAKLPEEARKDIHASGWAWLGDAWPVVAVPAVSVKAGKPEARKESIRALLAAIQESSPDFSPDAMPGMKADFFELCRAWNPDFRYVVQDTFNDYLPGLCKFGRGARATDFYREIAPRIGVKLNKPA